MASPQERLQSAAQHLRDMTLSQRVAIGLGALLVAGSLGWLVNWAATSEMVPLLPQPLAADELSLVQAGLESLGQDYDVRGAMVLVPASANRQQLQAQLQQMEHMPTDTSIGFSELVREANPWISQKENERRWTVALKTELERVLREFNGVRDASVFLNLAAERRGFSARQPESTASVTLTMKGGEPVPRGLAMAAARQVAGAVRGLPLRNVHVVDSAGRSALDWDMEEDGSITQLMRARRQIERETEQKIKAQLRFDDGVLVNVSCTLEHSTLSEESSKPEEGVEVEVSTTETTTTRGQRSGQAGVEPNVGIAANEGGEVDTSTSETMDRKLQPGMTTLVRQTPAGTIRQMSAAINLPFSYLSRIYRFNNPDVEQPTEADVLTVFAGQDERIRKHVAKLLEPQDPEQVSVDWYYDVLSEPAEEAAVASLDTMELTRRYGPAAGLALLAVLSLFLLTRMARQGPNGDSFGMEIGLPRDALDSARRAAEELQRARAAAQSGTEPADEPQSGADDGVLEARELDAETVQLRSMLDQLSRMAGEETESMAGLVENWMGED